MLPLESANQVKSEGSRYQLEIFASRGEIMLNARWEPNERARAHFNRAITDFDDAVPTRHQVELGLFVEMPRSAKLRLVMPRMSASPAGERVRLKECRHVHK